jgi:regulator of CtrA degradation
MQLASWLLLQRAVNEGELTVMQASTEKRKVRLSRHDFASHAAIFDKLPHELRDLVLQSMRLQERILHLDQLLYGDDPGADGPTGATERLSIAALFERLRAAFPGASALKP